MHKIWTVIRANIKNIAKLLLTVAAIAYLVSVAKPEQVISYLAKIDLQLLLVIILLKFVTDLFKIWKWMLLARVQIPDFSFWTALRSFYMGMTLAVVTPFAIGELGRGALASQTNRIELSGLVLVDKIFDLATVTLFSLLGLAVIFKQPVLFFATVVLYFLGLLLMRRFLDILEGRGVIERVRVQFIRKVVSGFQAITNRLVLGLSGLSIVYFLLFYLQAYLIMLAYGENFPLEVIYYFPLITLSTIIPVTIGGLGIREGTAIYLLRRYQVPEAVAFNTFFMHFVIANVLAGLLGAFLFLLPRAEVHRGDAEIKENNI
jgi:uncharacterized protein (TIRG00374 family)